ncbi:MAG: helix-turn-helix domain-containing protein [Kiritimatiellae bacterium]|nr:helix-turn-helix domain-containing protein [Kiritimatiellia bacterium]
MQSDYYRIEKIIYWIEEHAMAQPRLKDIAEELGISPFHAQRLFKRWAGVTPKQFLQYLTVNFARQLLDESRGVLNVSFDVGLSGPGRLHDQMVSVDAVSPGEYKSQGEGVDTLYGIHDTPFGDCLIALTDRGICWLSFSCNEDSSNMLQQLRVTWEKANIRALHD